MVKKKRNIKDYLEKFWFIVWKDDSFKGWLISLVFIFILIKFVFFPLLSLASGTSLPLAIVESCSMHHEETLFSDFDSWWEDNGQKYSDYGITKEEFRDFSFKKGFTKGDILFITGANPDKLEKGDIIVFDAERGTPVIHRIIDIDEEDGEKYFSTLGDNNDGQISYEKEISPDRIIGKSSSFRVPYVGWIKLIFYEPLRPESHKGFC